jgi:orotate phosphoribosyltransferase/AMMECR1 domain-containing protein
MLREPLFNTLAALPQHFHSARAELLELLRGRGILYRSETQPILSRDGTSGRWMLDSLGVTLSPRGAKLAGQCLLELLKRFDGRQLATYGLTAVPILQSCILQDDRYRGLLVRKERKQHGSLKLIEGEIDRDEPVVLIDDSVSSGISMNEATARLEEAGLRVEGGICLVRFGWYGGFARMQERGYHMEAVYDIWDDFISHMDDEEKPLANPSKWFPPFEWHVERAPEGLHPARLARVVIAEYLASGRVLRAPVKLDADYDSAGGVWVSMRSRTDIHQRFARGGFWHFPGETSGSAAEDVVMAALSTASQLTRGEEALDIVEQSAFAVTFFGALEACTPGQLDNDRYGIVVRSLERRDKMGGALPRMPGIRNEWHQFQHARIKNAQLVSFEPYELFRHDVVKVIEPEIIWQPTGVPARAELPWHKDKDVCGLVAQRARDLVLARLFDRSSVTSPLSGDLLPQNVDSCYVTIYSDGQLGGCMGSVIRDLDNDLQTIVEAALRDDRFAHEAAGDPNSVAVTVSLLFDPLEVGQATPEEIVNYYRHGEQTVMAYRGQRLGILLPFVASTWNLDAVSFAQAVLEKAGLTEPPYRWCRFDCTTWLADSTGVWPTRGGFKLTEQELQSDRSLFSPNDQADESAAPENRLGKYTDLHVRYLLKHLKDDGTFYSRYQPFQNRLFEGADAARQAHGAWVLARASKLLVTNTSAGDKLQRAAESATDVLLAHVSHEDNDLWLRCGDEIPSVAELSFLLLALCNLPRNDSSCTQPNHDGSVLHAQQRSLMSDLAATLWRSIELPHGRVRTHPGSDPCADAFQDYFPGQVLLALAAAVEHSATTIDHPRLDRAFRYYRHRFRYKRHFGQVTWLLQAFSNWWHITKQPEFAGFVFEVADWLLNYQQEKTGAFINDHQSDTPGYTTAVYLEGLAAALAVAAENGDHARHQRYRRSFSDAFSFLDHLIVQQRDYSLLPNLEFALGGLRQGLNYSEIRTDFVQHSLSALLEFQSHESAKSAGRIDGPALFTV